MCGMKKEDRKQKSIRDNISEAKNLSEEKTNRRTGVFSEEECARTSQ